MKVLKSLQVGHLKSVEVSLRQSQVEKGVGSAHMKLRPVGVRSGQL